MTRRATYILFVIFLLVAAGCATTGAGGAGGASHSVNIITGVDVSDYSVEIKMKNTFTSSFTVYKPSDPYTVVVELPDVDIGDVPEEIVPGKKGISEIKFFTAQTPSNFTRIEILLDSPTEVTPKKTPLSLVLSIEEPDAEMAGLSETVVTEAAIESGEPIETVDVETMGAATEIVDVSFDFREDMVRFEVTGNGTMDAQVFTLPGRIVIDIPGAVMKTESPETVLAPVKAVRVGQHDSKTRLVLDVTEDVEFIASARLDKVVVSMPVKEEPLIVVEEPGMRPKEEAIPGEEMTEAEREAIGVEGLPVPEEEEAAQKKKKKYTGQLVSLDFQDADIVPIFRFLGDIAGYNVVIHPSVKGRITLKLKNVPWDQALDIILEISNLGKSVEDNILRIAPTNVFTSQQEEAARLAAAREKVAELVQEAISLKHIAAADMLKRLQEAKAMSPRGTARIDERTNTLIINDTQETINKIRDEEIPYWDTPEHGTMQVLIEAKIVEVSTDTARQLGIRWGGNATNDNFSFIGDASSYDFSVNTPVTPAGPAARVPGGVLAIGYTETFSVNMSLEALESVSRVRKLANPRLITIDKQAATIKQGVQIPFSTVSSEGTKTEFQEATLELNVTPEIQPNGILKLVVTAKNDTPVAIGDSTGINKQEIQTQALVKDGQTLVLGGIYTNTEQENVTGVPLLSKIPLLGWLFKTRSSTTQPQELLIFITPKMVQ